MANHAYVSFWTRERAPETMLDRFERLLETFPLSATGRGFTGLIIRAVSPGEAPLVEHNLRGITAASDVIALAREHDNADCSYEVEAHWDVWQRNLETGAWQNGPEQVLLTCNGPLYDDGGVADDSGDFLADAGFEHMFTGHAGLLGGYAARSAPADPVEAEFLSWMTHEEHLHEYYEKTRANIQVLLNWVASVEKTIPLQRHFLWSEGEENLEARLDEILAVH